MKFIVLGGAGAMGQIAVRDLSAFAPNAEVVIADVSLERAEKLAQQIGSGKLTPARADILDMAGLVKLLDGAAVVINCAPYKFNVAVMEAALQAGCNYLDLGGLFHTTRMQLKLHEQFQQKKLLAVLGMGAAPGMTNVMAAYAADQLDQVHSIDMVVAGVDFNETEHPFLPPYALDTILDEYALEPMVFEDGKFVAKPPMSGEVTVDMPQPVGRVKAFLTLHSEIATLPVTYADKGIKRVTYSLGLPAEFHERAKFLVELGFGQTKAMDFAAGVSMSPRTVLARMIDTHPVPKAEPNDCEVVRVDVAGAIHGRNITLRMESVVHSHEQWKISCGALDTGVPPSIVAQMIANGTIKLHGVLAPEQAVPQLPFFEELAKRSIPMRMLRDEQLTSAAAVDAASGLVAGSVQ